MSWSTYITPEDIVDDDERMNQHALLALLKQMFEDIAELDERVMELEKPKSNPTFVKATRWT